ncbi:MAG: phosphoglycolate phosphatase [Pseudomonadota bacterium]
MKLPRPRLVIVDLDGTMIDSAPDIGYATQVMLERLGLPPVDQADVCNWIGNGATMLVKRAMTGGDMHPSQDPEGLDEALAQYIDVYAAHVFDRGVVFPGVFEGLKRLKEEGYVLACVTNKHSRFTRPLMELSGIGQYMDYVGCGDEFERLKPDPLPLLKTAERFNVAPERAVMVGDSINDVEAGRAAGFITVCVSYGYRGEYRVEELGADRVVQSLAEVPELFEEPV